MKINESDPCAKCGMELRAGEPFCPHCGAKRISSGAPTQEALGTAEAQDDAVPRGVGKWWEKANLSPYKALGLVALVVVAVAIVTQLNGSRTDDPRAITLKNDLRWCSEASESVQSESFSSPLLGEGVGWTAEAFGVQCWAFRTDQGRTFLQVLSRKGGLALGAMVLDTDTQMVALSPSGLEATEVFKAADQNATWESESDAFLDVVGALGNPSGAQANRRTPAGAPSRASEAAGRQQQTVGSCDDMDTALAEQRAVVREVFRHAADYEAGRNELAQSAAFRASRDFLDERLAGEVRCWLGQVSEIDSHQNGEWVSFDVVLSRSGSYSLEVTTGTLLSDGLIPQGTELYDVIAGLAEGDWVVVSFVPARSGGSIFNYRLTERGSTVDPLLEVEFTEVTAVRYTGGFIR